MIFTSGLGALSAGETAMLNLNADALVDFDTRSLTDLDQQIIAIGEIVGKRETAQDIVAQLMARREAILAQRPTATRRPTVLFEYCVCIKYDPDPVRRFAESGTVRHGGRTSRARI